MALPWTAPGYGQGIFPSQAPFFIPDKVDPHLIALIAAQREQNQKEIAGSIQGALSGLGSMIEQRRKDAIASQLLAGSAPEAEPLGIAGEPTPTGTPSAALSPQEIAQNKALGYPTQQLLHPSEIYGLQQHEYDKSLSDAYKQAQIAHLMGAGAGGRLGSSNVITGPNGQPMTLHDAFRLAHPELEKSTPDPWAGAITKRRGWIDEEGNFTTSPPKGSEGMKADEGPYAEVQFPKQKTPVVVPYGAIPPKGAAAITGRAPAQIGEKRMFGNEIRVWNGSQWTIP